MVKPCSLLSKSINHGVCTAEITGSVKYEQYAWHCHSCSINTCIACAKYCHMHCAKGFFYQGAVGCICSQEGYCKCVRHDFDPNNNSSNNNNNNYTNKSNSPVLRALDLRNDAPQAAAQTDPLRVSQDPLRTERRRTVDSGQISALAARYALANNNKTSGESNNNNNNNPSSVIGRSNGVPKQLQFCKFELAPLVRPPHLEIDLGSFIRYWEDREEIKLPPLSDEENNRHHFINKGFVLERSKNTALSSIFYYEIEILSPPIGRGACLAMGVILPYKKDISFVLRPLGLAEGEYGFHGNDGNAFFATVKAANYGPTYSTGDRVGCGVLSDGTVYFTLNGLYLGFPQSGPDAPKIGLGSTVCSIITSTGWDAHIKFYFDPNSFMFIPDEREFEVANFFREEPYILLPLLRAAFNGDDVNKTFELLKSVEFDLGASLLHALCHKNAAFARMLRPISLFC